MSADSDPHDTECSRVLGQQAEKANQHGGWAGRRCSDRPDLSSFDPGQRAGRRRRGSLIGHLRGGMSNSDLKEVGEATIGRAVEEANRRTKKAMKKEVRADARDIERAIDSA